MFPHVHTYMCVARYNEARIAELNRERQRAESRSRTTRMAKWKELAEQAAQDLQMEVGVPEKIRLLRYF